MEAIQSARCIISFSFVISFVSITLLFLVTHPARPLQQECNAEGFCESKIRVGIHLRRTRFFIPKLLVEFEKKYPNIEVIFIETKSEKMETMLLDGELDIIFTNKVSAVDKLNVISIYKDKLLLAVSPNNPACKYGVKIKGHEHLWLDLNHVKIIDLYYSHLNRLQEILLIKL